MSTLKNDSYYLISNFGKMFLDAYDDSEVIQIERKNVIICGMGGSAIAGNYLESLSNLNKSKNQVLVWRNYDIPLFLNNEWIALVISYSGNTEETLSMIVQLLKKKIETYVISSGGKLIKIAKKSNLKYTTILSGYPPRFALPIILGRTYKLAETLLNLETISEEMRLDINNFDSLENLTILKQISSSMLNNIPIILSDSEYAPLSLRFRCQLNENSKIICHNYIFPEFSHNAIVGFENLNHSNYCLVVIKGRELEHKRIKLHREFMEEYATRKNIIVYSLESKFDNPLIQMLDVTRMLDYISYHVAIRSKIDPLAVKSIDELKQYLDEN